MSVLTLYSASWCPDCLAAIRTLEDRGIKYNLVDIESQPEAVDIIIAARGKRVVPTLEFKGRFMDGNRFNRVRFEQELDVLLQA
ncbi:MAG: glutaredoxin family protein [Nitrospinae bacterium]|nr:glutaredoxin family protein [Nitrospinota bacterium]